MTHFNFDLAKQLIETPGAPGHEQPIRQLVISLVKDHVDECYLDGMGNLITCKKGHNNPHGKRILIAAHLDEISFMVNHIDKDGFLKFIPLGGFDPKTLTAMRVQVQGEGEPLLGMMGSKPIHIMSAEERTKAVTLDDFYIDLGLSKEEVEQKVPIGAVVTRHQPLERVGHLVSGKSLDNRISVYILVQLLRTLAATPYDVYGVFTVQEEVGVRGAAVAGHQLSPDFALALDVTIASDTPGTPEHKRVSQLGKGTAIKLYDTSCISDVRMVRYLKQLAEQHQIRWQPEILQGGGTDASGIQRMGERGVITGALSIPTRYIHQTVETVHPDDVVATEALLRAAVTQLDQFDWAF